MAWRSLFMFLVLFVLTPGWPQSGEDEDILVNKTKDWISLSAAQQYEETYWVLGKLRSEITGRPVVQQLISFDAQGTGSITVAPTGFQPRSP